ncbi:peptidylprolyl isomerase [Litorimonas taeanensis]|uniref:peptidylprolyl isomerase n=1 Tax=Litorimonas taeanensis TaxID=568099 RepID=A0A420WL05_9PROT|nr:peptidylprolyl isomerase [Litorimonas taeanensis]RKQ71592.1 peptidylprolyl isomerase [Litorimonas taeanensis]
MMHRFLLSAVLGSTLLATGCSAQESVSDKIANVSESEVSAPAEAWRSVDPENLIIIDTAYGVIGVELYPEIAPMHVEQIKSLVRSKFYDNVKFHRVIDGFMNQTGDGTNGDGTGDSDLPDIAAEFTFRRDTSMPVTLVGVRENGAQKVDVGFYKSLPVATQPTAQAMLTADGKVAASGLHCKGVTSMARTNDPNSANSQFFLMRDRASHLDRQYSIWGNTVMGRDLLTRFKVGTVGEAGFVPDKMNTVRIAADLPENERPNIDVMKTSHPAFTTFLNSQKKPDGTFPDICDIAVPTKAG